MKSHSDADIVRVDRLGKLYTYWQIHKGTKAKSDKNVCTKGQIGWEGEKQRFHKNAKMGLGNRMWHQWIWREILNINSRDKESCVGVFASSFIKTNKIVSLLIVLWNWNVPISCLHTHTYTQTYTQTHTHTNASFFPLRYMFNISFIRSWFND